jgi:hypothetical protein
MFYYCTIENYLVNKLLSIVGVSTFVDIAFADMEWKREDSDDVSSNNPILYLLDDFSLY